MKSKLSWILLLFSVQFILHPAYGDGDISAVMSRYIEWRGGIQAMKGLESIRHTGTLSVAGMQGSITLEQRRDGRLYQSFDLGVFTGTEVMTPSDSWSINTSGQLEDLGITTQQKHARMLQDTFADAFLGTSDLDKKALPPEQHDGKRYHVIRFTYENGDHYDMFIDPDTGAHDWTREVGDGKTIWHELGDWRMVGNLRFPFHERTEHVHAAENTETRWQDIAVNVELDPSLYTRPRPTTANSGIEGDTSTRWLPMHTYLNHYIFIRGKVSGHETDIILDSGAGITVLDERFAERAGIQGQGALQANGVSGSMTASLTDNLSIEIDNLHLASLTAAILDLGEVSKGLGRNIPVVLGKEIFNNFIVDIDYPRQRIAFRSFGGFSYEGPGKPLKLYPGDDGHKLLDIEIENHPPARVTLDTGSGQTITLFREYWDNAHHILDDGRAVSDILSGGVGGESISSLSTLSTVNIAGYTLKSMPAVFYTSDTGTFNTKRLAGNLGAGILNRFRVIFDYSRDRLILEPSADYTGKPFLRNRVGLQLKMKPAGISVVHVAKGSPAEKAGWKTGDRLAAVNGKPIHDGYRERWQKISSAPPGTRIELTNGQGITTSVLLADYY